MVKVAIGYAVQGSDTTVLNRITTDGNIKDQTRGTTTYKRRRSEKRL